MRKYLIFVWLIVLTSCVSTQLTSNNEPIRGELVCVTISNENILLTRIKNVKDCEADKLAKILVVKRRNDKLYLECKMMSTKDTFIAEYIKVVTKP
jgi:hypothetical protein